MEYKAKEEFIPRSIKIMEQYDKFIVIKDDSDQKYYEVTLLINCAFGILVSILDLYESKIPNEDISNEWGISKSNISTCLAVGSHREDRQHVYDIVKHIRNSIGHALFEPKGDPINAIFFEDYLNGDKTKAKNFEATIPVSELTKFIRKLCKDLKLIQD